MTRGAIISYGNKGDPAFRCMYCVNAWYLPRGLQTAQDESAQRAAAAGWMLVDDLPPVCPDCIDVHHRLTKVHTL